MKQIIFRLVAPAIPVYDVVYGDVEDGTFYPASDPVAWAKFVGVWDNAIQYSSLLGGTAYIKQEDFGSFVYDNINLFCNAALYSNFLVLTVKNDEDESTKED